MLESGKFESGNKITLQTTKSSEHTKTWLSRFGLVATLLCTFISSHAAAIIPVAPGVNPDVSYSATQITSAEGTTMSMKVYRAPAAMRLEINQSGQQAVLILREDSGENILLVPSQKMAMVISQQRVAQLTQAEIKIDDATILGEDPVNGVPAVRYKANFTGPDGAVSETNYWVSEEGIMLKAQSSAAPDGSRPTNGQFELSDLVIEPQDPQLFTIPDGYQKLGTLPNLADALASRNNPDTSDETADYQQQEEWNDAGEQQNNNNPLIESLFEDARAAAEDETRASLGEEARQGVRRAFGRIFKRRFE